MGSVRGAPADATSIRVAGIEIEWRPSGAPVKRLRPGVKVIPCSHPDEQEATQRSATEGQTGSIQKPRLLADPRVMVERVPTGPACRPTIRALRLGRACRLRTAPLLGSGREPREIRH